MSQFKGTKGKWFVEWNGHYNEILSTDNSIHRNKIDGVNMGISTHLHMTIGGKVESVGNSIEDRANAQLIAHSPEMIKALIKVNDFIKENSDKNYMVKLLYRELPGLNELIESATNLK